MALLAEALLSCLFLTPSKTIYPDSLMDYVTAKIIRWKFRGDIMDVLELFPVPLAGEEHFSLLSLPVRHRF